jgi:lipopolysaccharide export LptBFGC system permease protein LptF
MNIINLYLLQKTLKYVFQNIVIITLLILFINIIEISRLFENGELNLGKLLLLSLFKIPSIISETTPFIIIISIAFMYKNLISNNELISMRNIGYSIIDIFKPISLGIFLFGLLVLILYPISMVCCSKTKKKLKFLNFLTKKMIIGMSSADKHTHS